MIRLLHGDCLELLPTMEAESFDSCVTDPPYGLGFMAQEWDDDIALRPETWRAVFRVLKPGAHLFAFGGTRTFHRLTCAIEDAGFEIRDTLCWLYGSGLPKSHDVERAISCQLCTLPGRHYASNLPKPDKRKPNDHICPRCPEGDEWDGWGTAAKPAWEPIILARRPLIGTVAANVLAHGTGGLNIDACRVPASDLADLQKNWNRTQSAAQGIASTGLKVIDLSSRKPDTGRWPANVLHDGSAEVEAAFAAFGDMPGQMARARTDGSLQGNKVYGTLRHGTRHPEPRGDSGSASRFFFSSKADTSDRAGSKHPTVKPTDLMRWLVQLVTPPGGSVLDPFAGSGSTGLAADQLGFDATLIEASAKYCADIRHKITSDAPLFAEIAS